jgi:Holliday junction resolvase-like predicted endonuclease
MSKVSKGNYYRLRTKQWLQELGYLVENLERSQRIVTRNKTTGEQQVLFIRRDVWGADLIARNEEHVLFVQVKSNAGDVAKGMKELSKGPWPEAVVRWVVWWPARRRMKDGPVIVEVEA